jgi:hypothetical protein
MHPQVHTLGNSLVKQDALGLFGVDDHQHNHIGITTSFFRSVLGLGTDGLVLVTRSLPYVVPGNVQTGFMEDCEQRKVVSSLGLDLEDKPPPRLTRSHSHSHTSQPNKPDLALVTPFVTAQIHLIHRLVLALDRIHRVVFDEGDARVITRLWMKRPSEDISLSNESQEGDRHLQRLGFGRIVRLRERRVVVANSSE